MKIQTVNQLISVFKDISIRHYQINGFGIGDEWEIGASKAEMHPVLWINPVTATMPSTDNGYKTFEIDFEVRVFDLVSKGETNENDVLSDCIDILKDIITEFKGHPYYVNSQLNIIDDISFEAFTEEFDEEVSGWVCEISLMTPILNSFCGIPAADITGFEFPGTDCPEVNVLCPVFVEDVTGVYPIVVTTVGTTKQVSIVGGVGSDTFVVSGVYDTGTLTLTRNDAVDVVVTGFASGGDNDYTTAATLSGNIITFDRTDTVGAYSVDLTSAINSAPDKFVSSGAYDEINNKIVLTLNDASTVDIDTSAIGGGGASIYTADDTIGAGRVATLTDSLTFKDGTVNIQGIGTSGSSALAIYDNDTTPNKLWDFLDDGNVNVGVDSVVDINNTLKLEGGQTYVDSGSFNPLVINRKGSGLSGVGFDLNAYNSSNVEYNFARIVQVATDVANGSEDGGLWFRVSDGGSISTKMEINSNAIKFNDLQSVSTGLASNEMWSDNGFLRVGSVVGSGITFYETDGTLTGDRTVNIGGNKLNLLATGGGTEIKSNGVSPLVISRNGTGTQGVGVDFNAKNSSNIQHNFARVIQVATSNTAGSENGGLWLRVSDNGIISTKVQIDVDKTEIKNTANFTGGVEVNGNTGFTGTGAYTNFTIENGIITNAT